MKNNKMFTQVMAAVILGCMLLGVVAATIIYFFHAH